MKMNGTGMRIGVAVLALGVSLLAIPTSQAPKAAGISLLGLSSSPTSPSRPTCPGGLMSYGATTSEIYTSAAEQVAKILKGARPSELPLRQATRFELVINNRTAKALRLTIPPSLLSRADEVIE